MARQLIYSTVEEGIDGGKGCLCYAAASNDALNNRLILQNLLPINSYQQLYSFNSSSPDQNPVNFSHYRIQGGGSDYSILSRTCAARMFGGRSNFFAHHLVVENNEQYPSGPAYALMHFQFKDFWDNQKNLPAASIPKAVPKPNIANSWKSLQFDPGWAGWLAEKFLAGSSVHILYPNQINPLPLIQDAISQLPEHQRWKVGFSTYYTLGGNGPKCHWRFIPLAAANYAAPYLHKSAADLVLNLANPMGCASSSDLVRQARGETIEAKTVAALRAPRQADPPPLELPTFGEPRPRSALLDQALDLIPAADQSPSSTRQNKHPLIDPASLWLTLKVAICLLALFLPMGLTILSAFTYHRSMESTTLAELTTRRKELEGKLTKLKAELEKSQQDLETKKQEFTKKSTDNNDLEKELKGIEKWLMDHTVTEVKDLDAAIDFSNKAQANYLYKVQVTQLKTIQNEIEKIRELPKEIKKAEDVLQSRGKIITDLKPIQDFIAREAKPRQISPLDQLLETKNWLVKDKKASSYYPSDKTFSEAFQKWCKSAIPEKQKQLPPKPNYILQTMVATNLLLIQVTASKNLQTYAELAQPHTKDYLEFLKKQKNDTFTTDNLKNFFAQNSIHPKPVSTIPEKPNENKNYFLNLDKDFKDAGAQVFFIGLESLDQKHKVAFLDGFKAYLQAHKNPNKQDDANVWKAQQLLDYTILNLEKFLGPELTNASK